MGSRDIPAWILSTQHKASNPSHSVWVTANAGSGKTHVLANRVVRLLLQGIPPAKILCLTFTKAAAANMAERVFKRLALWTQLPDDKLKDEIAASGAPHPGSRDLAMARRLFARTLETPGGLKIQTIHAFCERLLHQFPFEANVPARFEVLDEWGQEELLQRARRAVLAEAKSGNSLLGAALDHITAECGQNDFETLITEAMSHRVVFRAAPLKDPAEILRRSLNLAKGRNVSAIEREMAEGGIAPSRWNEIAAKLDGGMTTDQNRAKLFRQAFRAYQSRRFEDRFNDCLEDYFSIFFTDEGGKTKKLLTNGLSAAHPDLADELGAEQERLDALRAECKAAATFDRTQALIVIASAIFQRYGDEKNRHGFLDFADLIDKTLTLLQRTSARWILYRLDSGIDHVLVDEAQDTSEAQWKILEELTGDFAAGHGQSHGTRTFFAVGDEKQSIFSFQGAAPKMFEIMRRQFETRFSAGAQPFTRVPLNFSFRSSAGVLAAIDRLFEHGDHKSGLVAAEDVWMPHKAVRDQLPAVVELWPLAAAQPEKEPSDWRLPLDLLDARDPANLVAERVAQKIAQLIADRSEYVHDNRTLERRPVRPGDILVLVRKRDAFFEALIRALKKNQIPAAGADRLELVNHIAILDLIAAGRASLLPEDDLALACLLKSPLIGLSDEDLMALALGRAGSLFEALQASQDVKHAKAANQLALWRSRAGDGPFTFYASLLCADGGRRAMEARLGPEAGDAIGEFLNLALAHENSAVASLSGFLEELAGTGYSIKREMEGGENVVRVMTVHAAKGLEAKIVFLPDCCGVPSPQHDPKIFSLDTAVPGEETIAWSPVKALDCEAVGQARQAIRDAAMEEYRRLLYVALTRAEERLYIAGFHGSREPEPKCWAKMIEAALVHDEDIKKVPAFWDGSETILRLSSGGGAPGEPALAYEEPATPPPPAWLHRPAPAGTKAEPSLRPSHAHVGEESSGGVPGSQKRREALRRGRLVHQLLQYLPNVAAPDRQRAALAFLSARAPGLDDTTRQELAGEALDVIGLPDLAGLFGPDSCAEVFVSGQIALGPKTLVVTGQVDRLGETANDVLVADYKTGTPCPLESAQGMAYLAQLALYRAVLAPLWPDKTMRMLLIWTQGPHIIFVPAEQLDAALTAFADS